MSFKPMHDLESLTDLQREQHYMDACAHFELPPELRLLEFMWLDASDGKRNLVLYAKKGATDMIRARQGISVISTVPANGPGYVAFIVEGKDINGRHEFAVGSASIGELKGQNLANVVMIAHTRGVRRLTLQFVGGGLLDESEVQGVVSDISRSGASLASLATLPAPIQPVSTPNAQPGKDITSISLPLTNEAPSISGRLATQSGTGITLTYESGKGFTPPLMVAPAPFSSGSIIPDAVEQITETSQPLVQIEPAVGQKRHRRTKAEMAATRGVISLDSPVSAPVENVPVGEIGVDPTHHEPVVEVPKAPIPDSIPDKVSGTQVAQGPKSGIPTITAPVNEQHSTMTYTGGVGTTVIIPENQRVAAIVEKVAEQAAVASPIIALAEAAAPAINLDMPTKEETAVWKSKLSPYTTQGGILNQGGMTENLFGKIRLYTMTLFPDAIVLPSKAIMLTNNQWADLLGTFKHITAVKGPSGLVNAIESLEVLK
jgi:hypothetical protein